MADEKDVQKLVAVFEDMYKYYHGWHFEYAYPGFFVYHQMGGDLSIFFTPDWNELGKVSIQLQDLQGEVISSQDIAYQPPSRNGAPYEKASAYTLFRAVKPYLDANMNW